MFAGFSKDAPGFFHELSVEMNRDWFLTNKERYEATWVAPMTALLDEVRAKLCKAYGGKLGAPKIMRIHRDVRFSKNKQPYKTHIGASIATAKGHTALYLHLGVTEEFVGCGAYFFEPKQLVKWRKTIAGKGGEPLAKLVAKLRKTGYEIGGHDDYVRVPKSYAADHPRAELLKQKGLTGAFPAMPKGLLHKAGLVDWIATHGKAMAPLVTWLDEHV